jgi:hypothetical protein
MIKLCYILFIISISVGCVSENRTNLPSFKIALNRFTIPNVNFEQFDNKLISNNKIKKCIYFQTDSFFKDSDTSYKKLWALNFDSTGSIFSKEFYSEEEVSDVDKVNLKDSKIILRDTSYWLGNKHYFELVTNKERILHFTEFRIKNNIGEKVYDSTFIINRNWKSNFYVVKYDLNKNQVLVNSNGRKLKKVFTYKNGKIIKVDHELMNSRCVKKDLFYYNEKGVLVQMVHAFNNVLKDEITSVKKYIYNDYGLISYVKYYDVLSGNLNSLDLNNLELVELNLKTEKYEWVQN